MKSRFPFLTAILFVLITASSVVWAHLDAELGKVVDGYKIDLGYSPEKPTADDKVILSFNLLNETYGNPDNLERYWIAPSSVWVRISSSKEVVFAGKLYPEAKSTAFSYKFPYPDNYEVTVRFTLDNNETVEGDFKLEIEKKQSYLIHILLISIVSIIILIYIIRNKGLKWKRKNKKKNFL